MPGRQGESSLPSSLKCNSLETILIMVPLEAVRHATLRQSKRDCLQSYKKTGMVIQSLHGTEVPETPGLFFQTPEIFPACAKSFQLYFEN